MLNHWLSFFRLQKKPNEECMELRGKLLESEKDNIALQLDVSHSVSI